MKLFRVDVRFKNKRRARYGAELVVHAKNKGAAEDHVRNRYAGCTIERTIELAGKAPKHFVIADLVAET